MIVMGLLCLTDTPEPTESQGDPRASLLRITRMNANMDACGIHGRHGSGGFTTKHTKHTKKKEKNL